MKCGEKSEILRHQIDCVFVENASFPFLLKHNKLKKSLVKNIGENRMITNIIFLNS